MFTKTLIFQHFDPKYFIWINTNVSAYAIGRVLSQLISDYLKFDQGQLYPIAYFSREMILAKIMYNTHNGEVLAIIVVFKIWMHDLKGCKYKVIILTNHNNPCWFIDTKSLSFRQVCWVQELFKYHFQINYQ